MPLLLELLPLIIVVNLLELFFPGHKVSLADLFHVVKLIIDVLVRQFLVIHLIAFFFSLVSALHYFQNIKFFL